MTRRIVVLAAALALVAAACGGGSSDPAKSSAGARERQEQGSKTKAAPGGKGTAKSDKDGGAASGSDSQSSSGGGIYGGGTGGTSASASSALRTASSVVSDPDRDAQRGGLPESYAELLEVAVEGLGEQFRITFTFAADVPDKMPDDKTFMVVGIGFDGKRDDRSFAFGAQGSNKGWQAFAGGQNKNYAGDPPPFPGEFDIDGNRMTMTVAWSFIKGPYPFRWKANSSWFRSLANTSHYSFDAVPNDEDMARYPN